MGRYICLHDRCRLQPAAGRQRDYPPFYDHGGLPKPERGMETDPVYLYRTGKLILYLPHAEHKGLSKQESYDRRKISWNF